VMALDRAMRNGASQVSSIYDNRGILVL